ncbi:hypothetical protein QO004_002529 [Rhizobium mesoamericanum]|uniref:hypothetical protein n=1 Tax=Rhizobium mesoamericanum TaxID=1079800 RepID=UPI002784127F|nr:hypothetical protein [Rhizobium mesoamericanum]MDQ0560740.1 hypothetical protein [Rhizobium mesoamericanum]
MNLEPFIDVYRLGGLDALNVALNGLAEFERHAVLKQLEEIGYAIKWRRLGAQIRLCVVWAD